MIVYVLALSVIILLIGYLSAISARDVVRLLISLELMFGAVFLSLIPLFTTPLALEAGGIAVITIFTSASELMVLIAAIIILDRRFRTISIDNIRAGGDSL